MGEGYGRLGIGEYAVLGIRGMLDISGKLVSSGVFGWVFIYMGKVVGVHGVVWMRDRSRSGMRVLCSCLFRRWLW